MLVILEKSLAGLNHDLVQDWILAPSLAHFVKRIKADKDLDLLIMVEMLYFYELYSFL